MLFMVIEIYHYCLIIIYYYLYKYYPSNSGTVVQSGFGA